MRIAKLCAPLLLLAMTVVAQMPAAADDIKSLYLSPDRVKGAKEIVGTVVLTGKATKDITVSLSSSKPTAAKVPLGVKVKKGSDSAAFHINSSAVAAETKVTITAKTGAHSRTATLTVEH